MAGPIELVKAHPIASTAAIVAVVAIVFMLSGSGDGGESYTTGSVNDDAAAQYAQYQAQQQGQLAAVGAQKEVALAENATAKYLADLQSKSSLAEIAANLALGSQQLALNSESTNLANTLAAKISGDQIKAQSDATAAQYSSIAAQIASQAAIAQASINAQVAVAKINKPKQGLFSKIFG